MNPTTISIAFCLMNYCSSGVELSYEVKVRCALVCVACDLPAGRKTCGFLSYNAHFGCSHCWKEFPGPVGSVDFSERTGVRGKVMNIENWYLNCNLR